MNPNIIPVSGSTWAETKKPAQQVPTIPESTETVNSSPVSGTENWQEALAQHLQSDKPLNQPIVTDNLNNFPGLSADSFPSLSSKANTTAPSRGKGKKGKGRKGQQVLTFGVQRMSIN